MKSAFLLSEDFELFEKVNAELVARGGIGVEGVTQVFSSDGFLFTFYRHEVPEEELVEGIVAADTGVEIPEPADVAFYYVECRSEVYFAEMAGAVARLAQGRTWVMDSNGVIWNASEVDPVRIVL